MLSSDSSRAWLLWRTTWAPPRLPECKHNRPDDHRRRRVYSRRPTLRAHKSLALAVGAAPAAALSIPLPVALPRRFPSRRRAIYGFFPDFANDPPLGILTRWGRPLLNHGKKPSADAALRRRASGFEMPVRFVLGTRGSAPWRAPSFSARRFLVWRSFEGDFLKYIRKMAS